MSPETKILLEEFKKEFKSYKDYVDVSPWMDNVDLHPTKGYLYSNKLLTEISLIETIIKSLSKFKEDVGEDYTLKPIQIFIKDAIKIVEMHLKRIDLYKKEYPLDESSGESEVKFHSDLFSQKTKTKVSLSKLNITEKETVAKSPELFFGDDNNKGKYVKAPLLMRETLSEVIPLVKTRTDNLNIDFNIPIINPATSNEMLINMKEKDIPKWDPHKHFFEQELSVIQFWQEEINKIKNGINIGGYHIHPWLYWHLNIFKFAWGSGKDKYPKNPAFRDNEYFFTEMLKMAEEDGRKGILMYGSRRISKALKNDEILYYNDGTERFIGDVKKGDIIIGGDGKPTSIIGVYPQGKVDLYKVSFEDGRSIICCKDHLWEVYDLQAGVYKTLPLKEIMKRYKYKRIHSGTKYKDGIDREKECFNYYIPLLTNPIEFEKIEKPFVDPYYLGLWLGDGSERNLTITNIDDSIIKYISEFSEKNNLEFKKYDISYKSIKKEGKFNKIWDVFKDKNLVENKHIPNECYRWSKEDRFDLLRGLMDSDGTISKNGDISFTNTNETLINNVEKLIRELGIGCKVFKKKGKYVKKDSSLNEYFLIRLYTNKEIFKLDRKKERITADNARNRSKRERTAIINIEYYGKDNATCIRVDNNDSLFLTTNSVVTHNSVVMASYLMRTLYTVRNAKCTVLGFTFNPDLKAITDYMQESITNMVPAFKINVNNNDTEKQILLGLKAKNGTDRYDHSTLSVTNLEDGSKKGGQKSAGPTPDAWAMDEIAKGDCITAYNAAKPSFAGGENGKWRLIPLLAGTAGEAALSVSAEKMLKNPEGFDLLPMNWDLLEKHVDPDSITWTRDKFPYFVPAQLSLETGDKIKTTLGDFLGEDELSPLQDIYMEKTDWIGAKKFYEEKRLKLENDIQLLASEVNSFPLKVEDCYLSTEKNKFPGLESKRRKDYIEEFGLWGEKGWVEKTYDGFYNFVIDNSKDIIWEYPYKGGNFDAPIVILDDPRPNDIEPPLGLYCIGFDDVKQDTSDGDSVISATIFKRSFEGGEWANRIVGWYDSRPDRKRDYYKNLYLLIKYFNARALHENEDNGFIDFMETNHYDDLYIHMSDGIGLASEENFTKNKNRKWGWSPHGANPYHLEQRVVAYTKQDGIVVGDNEGLSGIDIINHPMLLYEFYKYKKGKNADRIRSFGLALTLAQYYDKTNQYIKGRKKQIEHDIDTIKKNNVKLSKGLSYTKNLVKY